MSLPTLSDFINASNRLRDLVDISLPPETAESFRASFVTMLKMLRWDVHEQGSSVKAETFRMTPGFVVRITLQCHFSDGCLKNYSACITLQATVSGVEPMGIALMNGTSAVIFNNDSNTPPESPKNINDITSLPLRELLRHMLESSEFEGDANWLEGWLT